MDLARIALLGLALALAACDRAAPEGEPRKAAAADIETVPPVPLAAAPVHQCDAASLQRFRLDWISRASNAAAGAPAFRNHFNAKLDLCFVQVTVRQAENAGAETRLLYDGGTGELYGEYAGTAKGPPETCRVESLYCSSRGEWEVLVAPYIAQ